MHSSRHKKDKKLSIKDKKVNKLMSHNSDSDDSEHELSHYLRDRVKMMKEVLKIIKPKKIRSMAPSCIKNMENEEINSMLLEELLGISNKRLKAIFEGKVLDEDSSSTDEEQNPIDVISLDDVSDDDFVIDLDSDNETNEGQSHKHKRKLKEPRKRCIKKEKQYKDIDTKKGIKETANIKGDGIMDETSEQNLMSVLELLELQARARAIRSQLVLESQKRAEKKAQGEIGNVLDDELDAVIIDNPKETEIVISSSDSENESCSKSNSQDGNTQSSCMDVDVQVASKNSNTESGNHNDKNGQIFDKDSWTQSRVEVENSEKAMEKNREDQNLSNNSDSDSTYNTSELPQEKDSSVKGNDLVSNVGIEDIPMPEIDNPQVDSTVKTPDRIEDEREKYNIHPTVETLKEAEALDRREAMECGKSFVQDSEHKPIRTKESDMETSKGIHKVPKESSSYSRTAEKPEKLKEKQEQGKRSPAGKSETTDSGNVRKQRKHHTQSTVQDFSTTVGSMGTDPKNYRMQMISQDSDTAESGTDTLKSAEVKRRCLRRKKCKARRLQRDRDSRSRKSNKKISESGTDDADHIIIDLDQTEIDCVDLD